MRVSTLVLALGAIGVLGTGTWLSVHGVGASTPPTSVAYPSELNDLPEDSRRLDDVPEASPQLRARAEWLFGLSCAPCHGAEGRGDGAAALRCDPKPANFLDGVRLAQHSDPFLFHRITKGKAHTCMPAFSAALSRADRLALVRYLRILQAEAPPPSPAAAR